MIYFGGALKALDENGKIGGYLVRFTDAQQKDLTGEYFTADTYLGAQKGNGVDTIFHHGRPITLKSSVAKATASEIAKFQDHIFAPVKTKQDAIGIWAETVMDMSDAYEKRVFGLTKAGKLGWSSGAVGHLVKVEADGKITRWPIGEASITPTPAEPLNRALPIKSFEGVKFVALEDEEETVIEKPTGLAAKLNQHIDDLSEEKGRTRERIISQLAREAGLETENIKAILDGTQTPSNAKLKAFARILDVDYNALKSIAQKEYAQTINGMFDEMLAEQAAPSRWDLEATYCQIMKKLANAASAAQMAGITFDLSAKIKEATNRYAELLAQSAVSQIQSWVADGGDEEFYLKAIIDNEASVNALAESDLDTHSQLTVSVERGFLNRLRGNHEARVKTGRVMSGRNVERLDSWIVNLEAVVADAKKLKDESTPMASDTQKRAALTKHLLRKFRQRESIGA